MSLFAISSFAHAAHAQTERRSDAPSTTAPEEAHADTHAGPAPWRWPGAVVWGTDLRVAIPPATDFDRALVAHDYGSTQALPTVATSLVVPVLVEWLWIGGQLGVRGRTWSHPTHDAASLVAFDLLAVVRARFALGDVVELGASVGGGLGWIGVWVNGVMADQLAPRFAVQGELAFRIGRHFALGPRIGWDYFQWSGVNAYGQSVDAGGPYFGLSLEGRE